MNHDKVVIAYYQLGYRRIYNNFCFSFEIYKNSKLMLKRLCKSSLEALERLSKQSIERDKIVTQSLMLPYKRAIEKQYWKLQKGG
ncbi:hypothetical protein [Streptococcus sanguinis]|uniref:hypothetical protein n=1 Tax=Streptococcus sanguinis TaxID=1305 RepID=UPI001CC165EB|nr:hypothetical protein [Streptococcus sanguinis]MBZ2021400.1 hypothetical protein [Streptococcus sanguinis]MBZ2073755.1 hypothetical protein [Streptococcus sanguinis]MBZ2081678.1 hypothetical protein [Streptococcus sanguinis]MCC3165756.1 hypothetical protein [Streptococcus sanguinis]